uniref:Uncharacterized protein n=1 Tax=Arundo donax TaxID=35708 RepID=A0A0A9GRN6_ARUDO
MKHLKGLLLTSQNNHTQKISRQIFQPPSALQIQKKSRTTHSQEVGISLGRCIHLEGTVKGSQRAKLQSHL